MQVRYQAALRPDFKFSSIATKMGVGHVDQDVRAAKKIGCIQRGIVDAACLTEKLAFGA
jgi:hypothetical protein